MNGPRHTPKPWTRHRVQGSPDTAHHQIRATAGDDGRQVVVATVYPITDDGQPGGESEANAMLIETAPELLETCLAQRRAIETLMALAQRHDPETGFYADVCPYEILAVLHTGALCIQAPDAIAKATGQLQQMKEMKG